MAEEAMPEGGSMTAPEGAPPNKIMLIRHGEKRRSSGRRPARGPRPVGTGSISVRSCCWPATGRR
jgi:hypothetical protein